MWTSSTGKAPLGSKGQHSLASFTRHLFLELFPLQSLPFAFLRGQTVKKLLYFLLSFCIPKRKEQMQVLKMCPFPALIH